MLDLNTLNDVFAIVAARGDDPVAQAQNGGEWTPITGRQMYGRVRAIAETLQGWGIQRGDRVALVGENRWEWPVTDFAVLAIGAADVPLYQTLTPEQMAYILNDSGARAIFVSNKDQYEKLLKVADTVKSVEHVVIWDEGSFTGAENLSEIMKRAPELEAPDAAFDALLKAAKPEELASIIYTSGTTGDPKGVMLTHENMASNLRHSTDGLHITKADSSISFLPLSHALARHLDYALYSNGATISYLPKFDDLSAAMKSVKPTIFLAVPRVFEKVRQAVEGKASGFKKKILHWSLQQGAKHKDEVAAGKTPTALGWKMAKELVFLKVGEAFGGRVRLYISGGAPLGKETTDWFLGVGIRVMEGYGMTEVSPVISRNTFEAYRANTVGQVIPNMEARLASDGELEVRGSSVFVGYWQNEEATKKEFTPDGWFKTGDIGKLEDGILAITDRKKELMKTSGGKYIAPQPVESKLKSDGLVEYAALIGDNRQFVSVLISPNFKALEGWAKQNGVTAGDHAKLASDPKVQKLYQGIIEKVNGGLAHYETIKKVAVVPDAWSVEEGELTPSLKLKRRVIVEKYKDQIEKMYAAGKGD
ncbi:MAG: AMP-dependent synthetase/ligase [Janthinobacterium lividum]